MSGPGTPGRNRFGWSGTRLAKASRILRPSGLSFRGAHASLTVFPLVNGGLKPSGNASVCRDIDHSPFVFVSAIRRARCASGRTGRDRGWYP